jgi:hypothetical protein
MSIIFTEFEFKKEAVGEILRLSLCFIYNRQRDSSVISKGSESGWDSTEEPKEE